MTASSNALSESLTGRARAMHLHIAMATHTTNPLEHDHSGVRWLAPALVAMAALVLFAIAMLGYPYL